MIAHDITRLERRRDLFLTSGRILLLTGAVLWLLAILFYDPIHEPSVPAILLPTRAMKWFILGDFWPYSLRPIWGGPMHLLGLKIATWTISLIGLVVIAWVRIARGRWSRPGMAIWGVAFVLAGFIGPASRFAVYPQVITTVDFSRLAVTIDKRQRGMIARLEAGERPALPSTGGERLPLPITAEDGKPHGQFTDERVLVDRVDAETLRFGLAQRAWLSGDTAKLRRLLPIDLPLPPPDVSARNDLGHRLAAMGRAAGMASAPAGYPFPIDDWDRRWKFWSRLAYWLTQLMHLTLPAGVLVTGTGLLLRRRHAAIITHAATLERSQPQTAPTGFGRKRQFKG
jgi:hypothetical protein